MNSFESAARLDGRAKDARNLQTQIWPVYSAAARRAARTPSATLATNFVTDETVVAVALPLASSELATSLTIAVPTTTPSAAAPIRRACSAVLTPKPTQTGSAVWLLIRATAAPIF